MLDMQTCDSLMSPCQCSGGQLLPRSPPGRYHAGLGEEKGPCWIPDVPGLQAVWCIRVAQQSHPMRLILGLGPGNSSQHAGLAQCPWQPTGPMCISAPSGVRAARGWNGHRATTRACGDTWDLVDPVGRLASAAPARGLDATE